MQNQHKYPLEIAKHNYQQLPLKLLLGSILALVCLSQAHAASGPGGIVQGVVNYPNFKAGPLGFLGDMDDPAGNPYPPYVQTFAFPQVDDAVYTPGIPGVSVYLKNTATNTISNTVVTDTKGAFVFPSQPAGNYALCWSSGMPGLPAGCSNDPGSFGYQTFNTLDHASNRWVANLGSSYIMDWSALDDPARNILAFEGYVQTPGLPIPYQPNLNTTCVHSDPFFGLDETATVQLLNTNNQVITSVKANSLGRYLITIPGTTVANNYILRAGCGKASVKLPINGVTSGRYFEELTLPFNFPPVITALSASSSATQGSIPSGTALSGVPLGATVHASVTATDSNGDTLFYLWKATAGSVVANGSTASWTLPTTGKGLHFLYVDVSDYKGGHQTQRIALSTDASYVAATPTLTTAAPADFYKESDRFLTYRGIDTKKSACQYYLSIGAVTGCTAAGDLIGGISFSQWLAKFGLTAPPSPYSATPPLKSGEFHAQFRNVADLNLIRNHHGRNTGPDANGKDHVGYYVCNHAKATGATPDANLVACVNMEYSVTPGQNDGKPFTKFLTFGPTGQLIASVNLDGRGEKYMPGNCVPCHGGDNYFHHFPESGAGAHDGNIGSYFVPFDLDNFTYEAPYTRSAQEAAVRSLNLGLKVGEMVTSAARELIDGWYPTATSTQNSNFLPKGWNPALSPKVPVIGQPDNSTGGSGVISTFNGADLYQKVVKPSCRGCHLSMGTPLGLDFHSYDYDGVTPGDFISGNAIIPRTSLNDLHTYYVVCEKYHSGLPTFNVVEDLKSPAKTMPNAIQTFNRYWNSSVQTGLMQQYFTQRGNALCEAPGK